MTTILVLILFLTGLISLLNVSWTPHEMVDTAHPEMEPFMNALKILLNALYVIQVLLLILLSYCGFKTGQYFKRTE